MDLPAGTGHGCWTDLGGRGVAHRLLGGDDSGNFNISGINAGISGIDAGWGRGRYGLVGT